MKNGHYNWVWGEFECSDNNNTECDELINFNSLTTQWAHTHMLAVCPYAIYAYLAKLPQEFKNSVSAFFSGWFFFRPKFWTCVHIMVSQNRPVLDLYSFIAKKEWSRHFNECVMCERQNFRVAIFIGASGAQNSSVRWSLNRWTIVFFFVVRE